jgi:hypothetical protein
MTAGEMKDPKKKELCIPFAAVRVGICCSDCCIEKAPLNKNSEETAMQERKKIRVETGTRK